jgi:hypothetical protein
LLLILIQHHRHYNTIPPPPPARLVPGFQSRQSPPPLQCVLKGAIMAVLVVLERDILLKGLKIRGY